MKTLCTTLLISIISLNSISQDFSQFNKIVPADRSSTDRFGYALSIDGGFSVIGAPFDDEDLNGSNSLMNAGSAYIFIKNGDDQWSETQKLIASDRSEGDNFGNAVAISGNYLVIASYRDDKDENGQNTLTDAGSVYVFEKNSFGTWIQVQKLVASDRDAGDYFGIAVSISGDYLVVGAYGESEDEFGLNTMTDAGSAYVFERDGNGTWNEVQKLVASDRNTGDILATSVSISGNYLVLTARAEDEDAGGNNTLSGAGSAYIFERDGGGTWNEVQKIVASDRNANDIFGAYASLDGNYLFVGAYQEDEDANGANSMAGAGSVYIFERDGNGTWNQEQKIVASDRTGNDNFGWSVSVNGNYAIVGAYRDDVDQFGQNFQDAAGSAYIFNRENNGTWSEVQKIVASDRFDSDYFGSAVGVSDSIFICGAYREDEDHNSANTMLGAGSAYVYEYCPSVSSFNIIACNSYAVPSGDEIYTSSGVYLDTIPNVKGCDSVMTINLTIIDPAPGNITTFACNSFTVPSGDETYTSSGIYKDTIPGIFGCDSIINIDLTIGYTVSTLNEYVCESYTVPSGDETYTTSGVYTDTIPSIYGCDSIITINLTVANTINVINESVCLSYTVPSGDETYTASGTYYDTIPSFYGCDSILQINLDINTVNVGVTQDGTTLTADAEGTTYQWLDCDNGNQSIPGANAQSFTATSNGSYAVVITENHCMDTSACFSINNIGLESVTNSVELNIYPNPNNGEFTVSIGDISENWTIEIYDKLGQVVYSGKLTNSRTDLHLTYLNDGVYFVKIFTAKGMSMKQVVIQQ